VNFRHRKLEWKRLQSNEGFVVSPRDRPGTGAVLSILEKFYRSYRYIVQIVIREKAFASVVGLANF
jgi:hypothetical protein